MTSKWADRLHEIPSHCDRICRNWKLSSPSSFFVPPIKSPSPESYHDWEFVKTLAIFSEEMKGKLLPVARECLRIHMQAMKKTGEEPDARDLWFAKCMAARKLKEAKNRTNEDRQRDEVIRKEGELMAKRIEAARAKGFSGEVRVDTNGKPPKTHSQDATKRQKLSKLPPQQDSQPAGAMNGRYDRKDQGDGSLRSHGEHFQPDEDALHEAPSLHGQFAGIGGDDGLLEELPDDPKGTSFDDLRTLHLEKDQLYQAQEDYYHALRLQILARYRRMHMSYSSAVRVVESRIDSDQNGEVINSRGNGIANRKRKVDTSAAEKRRRRAPGRHRQLNEAVDEAYDEHQSDIEDRISFYNFGFAPEDEHLTREEEIQLLPFDIDIAEIHAKRYQLRDRFPGGYKNSDISLIASGRAFYAARRLKLLKMRQDAAAESAQVEAESQ